MGKFGLSKINGILLLIISIVAILYAGSGFLKPLTFAFFFATLMRPVCLIFERLSLSRLISSLLCTFMVFLGIFGLFLVIIVQVSKFSDDLPEMANQLQELWPIMQDKVAGLTGISPEGQINIMQEKADDFSENVQQTIQGFIQNFFSTLGHFLLTLVYLFLFLIHRARFKKVILSYVPENDKPKGNRIISKSARVAHHYLWGRIKVMLILAFMYLVAFLAFGIQYALLFTVVGALLTIIPYIGPLLSGVLPVAFTLLKGEDFSFILLFASTVFVIQLIESYILEPVIIGEEVDLTPLFIIIAIVLGGILWGILGMVLFVPLLAIIKIVFDEIEHFKPIGYLFGNSVDNEKEDKNRSGFGKIKKLFKAD